MTDPVLLRTTSQGRRDEGAAVVAASWGLAKWPHSLQAAQKNGELIDLVKPLFTLAKDFFCHNAPLS
jgi:hypothetical protein